MKIEFEIPDRLINNDLGYVDIRVHKDKDHINYITTEDYEKPYFAELPFAVDGGWIPLGKGLPDEAEEILVTLNYPGEADKRVRSGFYLSRTFVTYEGTAFAPGCKYLTAWKKQEPYKGERMKILPPNIRDIGADEGKEQCEKRLTL